MRQDKKQGKQKQRTVSLSTFSRYFRYQEGYSDPDRLYKCFTLLAIGQLTRLDAHFFKQTQQFRQVNHNVSFRKVAHQKAVL
jgi:hypothetical protein